MKNLTPILSLFLGMLLSVSSMAQEVSYEPFIVEGKVWYYEHVDNRNSYIYKVYFEGDTVINGHECKKMVEERPGFETYSSCSCREEGGKVWVYYSQYSNQPWKEYLLFDFTCQEGDTLTNILVYGGEKFRVDEVNNIRSFNRDRRRIALRRNNGSTGYWLEGVGNRFNLFSMWPVTGGASERFLYCKLNGEIIADQSSFGDAALENFGLEPKTVLGDVDDDGTVSVTDVAWIVNHILGVDNNGFIATNADINSDGEIDINDVMGTVSIILGDNTPQAYITCPDDNHPHIIDLDLPSGTYWSCCNVGATTPEGYGGYYAWGETEEKDCYSSENYQFAYKYFYDNGIYDWTWDAISLGDDIAGTQYDVAHVKWGGAWQMPSSDLVKELFENCTFTWTTKNGVRGGLFTGLNGGTVFIPAAGYYQNDCINEVGSCGHYWSSTQDSEYSNAAYGLGFFSDNFYGSYPGDVYWYYSALRNSGHTVRPVWGGR